MADKKASWGQKAQEAQRPDPREFIFRKDEAGDATQPPALAPALAPAPEPGGGQAQPVPGEAADIEPMVRITVDVRKSLHKQLQRVCNERDVKLAPFIRELIERELTKLEKAQ